MAATYIKQDVTDLYRTKICTARTRLCK